MILLIGPVLEDISKVRVLLRLRIREIGIEKKIRIPLLVHKQRFD